MAISGLQSGITERLPCLCSLAHRHWAIHIRLETVTPSLLRWVGQALKQSPCGYVLRSPQAGLSTSPALSPCGREILEHKLLLDSSCINKTARQRQPGIITWELHISRPDSANSRAINASSAGYFCIIPARERCYLYHCILSLLCCFNHV